MKALIIGGAGFVGGHLIEYLSSLGTVEVFATKLQNEKIGSQYIDNEKAIDLDITNLEEVSEILFDIRPDYIFQLAAQSSISLSWKSPALTYNINIIGTLNILEAIRKLKYNPRILLIGSAEEYGEIRLEGLPITEELPIKPCNPYAVSKAAQEMTARMYVECYSSDIVMVRAFNHIGPGQSPTFVISDFAKQIAEIEKGARDPILHVGNIDIKRDFSDVRDIVKGYWLLMQRGEKGEVYNIGSGKSYEIRDLLNTLIQISCIDVEIFFDSSKFRPNDIPDLKADIKKIETHTGWRPSIDIRTSLIDVLNYWRNKC